MVLNTSARWGSVLLIAILASVTQQAVGQGFNPAQAYPSGGANALSVAVADLNGDGYPDIVVANSCATNSNGTCSGDGMVGVLLGNGDGTFKSAVSYDSGGAYAASVAVGDVNGDGKPDIVVANECTSCAFGQVAVLLGNGDGTFQKAVTHQSGGSSPVSVALADLTGNGTLDIVVTNLCVSSSNCDNGVVAVLLGNGNGAFQSAKGYNSGAERATAVAIADVNDDGNLDLLVANSNSPNASVVGVLLGNGNGTFRAAVTYATGGIFASSIAVADVNGDGKPDLLVANGCGDLNSFGGCDSAGTAAVLLGNGDGTFQSAVTYGSGGGFYSGSIAAQNVDGDGKIDLVLANSCGSGGYGDCTNGTGGEVSVLDGNGDGTFQPASSYASGGLYASSVAVADVNGDGVPDLVVANQCASLQNPNCEDEASGGVGVLIGTGMAAITLVPASLNFGNQTVGVTTSPENVTLTNTGNVKVSISSIQITGANGSDFAQTNNCPGSVPLKGSCNINVTFTPTATGARNAAVTITDSATGSPQSVSLTGTGVQSSTTTTLSSSPNPSNLGQAVNLSATVTAQGSETPTGTVSFYNGNTLLGTTTLVNGKAGLQYTFIVTCSCSVTATYAGDSNNQGSSATPLIQYVMTFPIATTTTVATSASPVYIGQPVTFTATVSWTHGAPPDGELVTFKDVTTSTVLGTAPLSHGVAMFTTSSLARGSHTIKAKYPGDTTFAVSSATLTQVVQRYPTTTSLSSTPNPSNFGQLVTLTAQVSGNGPTPTGTVTFYSGQNVLGTSSLNSSAVAQWSTSTLSVGTDALTAAYNADMYNKKSTSPIVNQVVK